ncbi:[FeFe] hydrogenase H-cluster radical SAM maturase HydE [Propionivibrio soli]|uniref:[FeFe] hydrogenase H-cluster radical SAM maturase HydE n=1 Tax=Propionivibrio soli TaxID=2976531 RepID=UPI0021E93381
MTQAVRIEWKIRSRVATADGLATGMSSSGPDERPVACEFAERLTQSPLDRQTVRRILGVREPDEVETVRRTAERVLLEHCGDTVRLRGLIEFSNRCTANCYYCGIRRGNRAIERYTLDLDEIVETAEWSAAKGYGSVVLQSGERRDPKFARFVTDAVRAIKAATRSPVLPEGVGITLCVGEQDAATYEQWFAAGAHRYLLRIETSSPTLFRTLHPVSQSHAARLACLHTLKSIGYRVGTGVMIGVPGQSIDDLADDVMFFRDFGIDMIGMGPYIPHAQAPLRGAATIPDTAARLSLALKMIAAARLAMPDINIAATTALQTLAPDGREQGLRFGANVIMPQVTPPHVRRAYTLYDGKPCLDDDAGQCADCLERRIQSVGRSMLRNQWGDRPRP